MATIVLSAVGAAAGSAIGGSVLGLSSVLIGQAIGATVGQVIDQQLMGVGSDVVETGQIERFRLTGASEGASIKRVYGRTRIGGQVIWASRFEEHIEKSGGGKSGPTIKTYRYSVSLAVALCEGEISGVGRIWADGVEIAPDDLTMRVYQGSEDQLPDPKMEAMEGVGAVPSYRGMAYVVIEDLYLDPFGNRVPQLSFEVFRPVSGDTDQTQSLSDLVQGVALIPGSGEFALATTPVNYSGDPEDVKSANINSPAAKADLLVSLDHLTNELPQAKSTLLVTSWFGDDLRCGVCQLKPKVEQWNVDTDPMKWRVSGLNREDAERVPYDNDAPVYGGTPADPSIVEAVEALRGAGHEVVFYPFILMDQLDGNLRTDPWTGETGQPALPWRGRITTSLAPQVEGTTDGTLLAEAEVDAFFGTAQPSDFTVKIKDMATTVNYAGPDEWSYRRFILHYAHLCAAAGGVDAFCIGSEMRSLTQVRGINNRFPAVIKLRQLATDVRAILGPETKIGYAADWSEYFGYHPQDGSGDVFFHLDPLWADDDIDFIGIDNYMPMSDWRDGDDHADAEWGDIYQLPYLHANIEGGEGYDWYYPSEEEAKAQLRAPIEDGAYGEPWVFRYKDIRNWWLNTHHDRIGGVRSETSTDWVPQSKPFWFTEYGCAAINKGTNQPNRFLDPKSSENGLPKWSDGIRDDVIQHQYIRAMTTYWARPENNPVSNVYGAPMLDMSHAHVWAWDTRPFPWFPANEELWSDADNFHRGHWINGRASAQSLAAVVQDICRASGVSDVDVERLSGILRGFQVGDVSGARQMLQPLMLAYGFDVSERDGKIVFRNRSARPVGIVDADMLVHDAQTDTTIEALRAPAAETAGRVRLNFTESNADYEIRSAEAVFADEESRSVSVSNLPLVLSQSEGQTQTERWLSEARVARDRVRLNLPLSQMALGAGDVFDLSDGDGKTSGRFRIDRVEQAEARAIEAVRVDPAVYEPSDAIEEAVSLAPFIPPLPVYPLFLDLPLLTGDEVPHSPHIAATATPWPGTVSVYSSPYDTGYELNTTLNQRAVIGRTETALVRAQSGVWDRGAALRVRLFTGALSSVDPLQVLDGANAAAIGDGSSGNWEVFQFANAELVGENTYDLSLRLRGQLGSDALMPDFWPEGSLFVLLDGAMQQIALGRQERGLSRNYRIGPAGRPFADPSYTAISAAFDGNGLRPYAPVHLAYEWQTDGGLRLSWVRRTRIDGDSWEGYEVPLGEASQTYLVRLRDGDGAIALEAEVGQSDWTVSAAQIAAAGLSSGGQFEVAQISDSYGAGLFAGLDVGGA